MRRNDCIYGYVVIILSPILIRSSFVLNKGTGKRGCSNDRERAVE